MNNMEIWQSEYELRQFIDMATRWSIETIYKTRTNNNPFSLFSFVIEHSRENLEKFSTQINQKLTKAENWGAIEIDLKDRFLPMINLYIKWYSDNETEIQKFDPYNPYGLMLGYIESTKREILKYFPEGITPHRLTPQQLEGCHNILINEGYIAQNTNRDNFILTIQNRTGQPIEWIGPYAEMYRFCDFLEGERVRATKVEKMFFRTDRKKITDSNRSGATESKIQKKLNEI